MGCPWIVWSATSSLWCQTVYASRCHQQYKQQLSSSSNGSSISFLPPVTIRMVGIKVATQQTKHFQHNPQHARPFDMQAPKETSLCNRHLGWSMSGMTRHRTPWYKPGATSEFHRFFKQFLTKRAGATTRTMGCCCCRRRRQ